VGAATCVTLFAEPGDIDHAAELDVLLEAPEDQHA
jgi:hypothetical protein